MKIHADGDHKLRHMTNTLSMCAMVSKVTDERLFIRYRGQDEISVGAFRIFFTRILACIALSTLGLKNAIP
jgi:hypothetical protein